MVLRRMVRNWFARAKADYNDFVKALLLGDVEAMNEYMNRVALETFSSFDTGKHPAKSEPERFYHGFVLGLMVELAGRYALTSNRESGFGRYDVMLEPLKEGEDAFILEFKVFQIIIIGLCPRKPVPDHSAQNHPDLKVCQLQFIFVLPFSGFIGANTCAFHLHIT